MENVFCSKCGTSLVLPKGLENSQFIKCCNCDNTFKNPYFGIVHRIQNKPKPQKNYEDDGFRVKIVYITFILFLCLIVFLVIRLNSTKSSSPSYDSNSQQSTQSESSRPSSDSNSQQSTQSESITAYHVTQDTYAATSEGMFHEMFKYFKVNDEEAINTLLDSGDMKLLPKGTELYLLGGNGFTFSIVRESGSTQKLWVVPQHIAQN